MSPSTTREAENPVGPTSERAPQLSLTIVPLADNAALDVEVAADMTPAEILEQLVIEGHLPAPPAGQQYQLFLKDSHLLDDGRPLGESGVEPGSVLRAITTTPGAAAHVCGDERPEWLKTIAQTHAARAAHFFLMSFNTADYVFDGVRAPRRLLSYIAEYLRTSGFQRIGLLNCSDGLAWVAGGLPGARAGDPATIVRALVDGLAAHADSATAVIIENVECFAPAVTADREALRATELILRLAQDDGLRASGCIVFAICHRLETVAPALVEAVGGACGVVVPLPDAAVRRRFLDYLATDASVAAPLAPLEHDLSPATLANLTQGVSLAELDLLNRRTRISGESITFGAVRTCKKNAIEKQSRGLIEELQPLYGFDAVGGLAYVVDYLKAAVGHLREQRLDAAPQAVLLAGPPGTGKTLVAEALAKEAGFNLVRLGDLRSMWVGESERNLSHALRLLTELAPVVVFVDEVDQMLGGRDRGWNGDSGVSGRLFARIMNVLGRPEQRGRIIWVAATNRADLLDAAMLRRFDRVFPFFVPGAAERRRIFLAMPAITRATYTTDIDLTRPVAATEGLTGSAIEVIVRRARELSTGEPIGEDTLMGACDDYKPNHDPREYLRQSLAALDAANLFSALPRTEELPPDIAEVVREMRVCSSAAPLHERMRMLDTVAPHGAMFARG